MSDVKWIKIVTDIFDDEKMYAIETLPDGITIEVVWFKILCLAGKCNSNGFLTINSKLAYTDEMLAKVFRLDVGIVQRALDVFQRLDMIEMVDNAYMVSNWLKYQSGDKLAEIRAKGANRQRKFRERQRQEQLEQKENEEKRNVTDNVTDDVTVTDFCSYSKSYSFSSNNNIENLNYLLSGIYKDSIYINNNTELLNIINDWMGYKDERTPKKDHHYTERGMKALLTEVINYDKSHGTQAVAAQIRKAIAREWRGMNLDMLGDIKTDTKEYHADSNPFAGYQG